MNEILLRFDNQMTFFSWAIPLSYLVLKNYNENISKSHGHESQMSRKALKIVGIKVNEIRLGD